MNVKRLLLSWLGVYVTYQALNFVFHQVLLAETYGRHAAAFRPAEEMMSRMWVMWLTAAVWTHLFCYIYVKGRESGTLAEGVRFGAMMGVFIGLPFAYESWALYPLSSGLAHAWFVGSVVVGVACGVVAAIIYQPRTEAMSS